MERSQLLDLALNTPPVEWDEVANRWINSWLAKGYLPPVVSCRTMAEAIQELDGIIIRLVRFRAYLDMRYGNGCGDQGHNDGVKEQNKLAAKVRKALGYTKAKDDITFGGEQQ